MITDPLRAPQTVSIIVPTYKEAQNLPPLIDRIAPVRQRHSLTVELLIMDDDSRDGTEEVISTLARDEVRLIVRKKDRGLSPAVVDGLAAARHDVFVVMDADLSHPPEKVPEMLAALDEGYDFVIGSRYVKGASTDAEWGPFRWLNSKVATVLARPCTRVKDPMSRLLRLAPPDLRARRRPPCSIRSATRSGWNCWSSAAAARSRRCRSSSPTGPEARASCRSRSKCAISGTWEGSTLSFSGGVFVGGSTRVGEIEAISGGVYVGTPPKSQS